MAKRTTPTTALEKILDYDAVVTKKFVTYLLRFASFRSLKFHCEFLEYSCNGVVWLSTWMAFIWFFNNSDYHQMQLNMLVGLLLDIVCVAVVKAAVRRRRPTDWSMLAIGPDKFSFPSGHSSRAFFLFMFFTNLSPVSMIWWCPLLAWASSVAISRLILERHFLLDVLSGILLGIVEAKRTTSTALEKILKYDELVTKKFVTYLLQFSSFKSLKFHCKFLEYSCHGIAWLASWMAFIWFFNSRDYHQMQLNMLVGLLLDIVFVAVIKAAVRRRRPTVCSDMLTIGPDKFSFPSGHASRAFFLLMFFTMLSPVSMIWWSPLLAWASSVALSRLILQRHYILDVLAGIVLGIVEAYILKLIWFSDETAYNVINYISNDFVPGGPE